LRVQINLRFDPNPTKSPHLQCRIVVTEKSAPPAQTLPKAYTATTPLECIELFNAVKATKDIPGEMADVGVYRGRTALMMLDAEPRKHLHLFDT